MFKRDPDKVNMALCVQTQSTKCSKCTAMAKMHITASLGLFINYEMGLWRIEIIIRVWQFQEHSGLIRDSSSQVK